MLAACWWIIEHSVPMSNSEKNIRREPVPVESVKLGMFVADLDRPWLGTPFLLQGFMIESEEQIQQLRECCKVVYVDRTLSAGDQHASLPSSMQRHKEAVVHRKNPKQQFTSAQSTLIHKTGKTASAPAAGKISFFDILRDLSADRKKTNPHIPSDSRPASSDFRKPEPSRVPDTMAKAKPARIEAQPDQQHGGLLGTISGWLSTLGRPSGEKLKNKISPDSRPDHGSNNQSNTDIITIYDDTVPVEAEIATIYPVFEQSQLATRSLFHDLLKKESVDIAIVDETIHSMAESIERNPDALIWLAKLKQSDDYTYNHALNVSVHMMALGHFIALPREQVRELGLAGLLQDVGKLEIEPALLNKTEKLSQKEFDILKNHVQLGLILLEKTPQITPAVLDIISKHHERVDGSGYPEKLSQTQISLRAQMAGIIDTYCALTSDKAYSKAIYNQKALDQIYSMRGREFSEALVDQLIQFMGIYPVSSLVELNTGEVAVVIQQNRVRRLLPRVMVLLDFDKKPFEYPPTLDLINMPLTPNGEPYKIAHGLPSDSYGLNPADFYL